VLVAYAVWFGTLLFWRLGSSTRIDEGIGWAIIIGMFLTNIVLPMIVGALKLVGVR